MPYDTLRVPVSPEWRLDVARMQSQRYTQDAVLAKLLPPLYPTTSKTISDKLITTDTGLANEAVSANIDICSLLDTHALFSLSITFDLFLTSHRLTVSQSDLKTRCLLVS